MITTFDTRGRYLEQVIKSPPEYTLHKQIAEYLNYVLTPDTYFTTVENSNHTGDTVGMIKQAKDKAKGVKAGFPDIILINAGDFFGLEIKRHGNNATDKQREEHNKIARAGGVVEIVHGVDEVREVLKKWFIPTREK